MTIAVNLSATELMALSYAAVSPEEWIIVAAQARCQTAGDEIVKIAVDKYLELGESIPGSRDQIIQAAFSRGWVKSAKDRNAEYAAGLPSSA